jgi:hypothetical protein
MGGKSPNDFEGGHADAVSKSKTHVQFYGIAADKLFTLVPKKSHLPGVDSY